MSLKSGRWLHQDSLMEKVLRKNLPQNLFNVTNCPSSYVKARGKGLIGAEDNSKI